MASWNDLNICKQWLTNLDLFTKKIIKPLHVSTASTCCGRKVEVETVRYGRLTGEICSRCLSHEEQFLEQLKSLPDKAPYIADQDYVRPASVTLRKPKAVKKEKAKPSKEEREAAKAKMIREQLEKYGQGSLF